MICTCHSVLFLNYIRRIYSFKVKNNRIIFKHRKAFTETNMATSGLWEMVYLPIFILITDSTIGCAVRNAWCQSV